MDNYLTIYWVKIAVVTLCGYCYCFSPHIYLKI